MYDIWDNQFMSKHIFQSFNMNVSIGLTTLADLLNRCEACLDKTNNPIFNMQDFRYWLCMSILYCFDNLIMLSNQR